VPDRAVAVNAVELTAAQAWFVADALRAGSYPWVLAITPPYHDTAVRAVFDAERTAELEHLGVMVEGIIDPAVRQWVATTCRARRWLELRFVSGAGDMLRGFVARSSGHTVVALRAGALVTFTAIDVADPLALVPILTAGLSRRAPAVFDEFTLPTRIGVRADERLRHGAELAEVVEFLGIPTNAHPVVEAAFAPDRTYVEIVAGEHRDGHRVSTEVGVSVVDTGAGRILVAPSTAFDGEALSTFTPGTPLAIATAVERLTATLPDGSWFPHVNLTRDFDQRTEQHV
jgi:hypothetical protein